MWVYDVHAGLNPVTIKHLTEIDNKAQPRHKLRQSTHAGSPSGWVSKDSAWLTFLSKLESGKRLFVLDVDCT